VRHVRNRDWVDFEQIQTDEAAMKKITRLVLTFVLIAGSAHAQDAPRAEVSVGYSFLRLDGTGGFNQNGGSVSIAGNLTSWLGIVGDFGAYHSSPSGVGLDTYTYLAGPRFSLRKNARVTPFAQVLFGGAHLSAGAAGFSASINPFVMSAGGGIDLRVSQHVALRPQFDYLNFRASGQTGNGGRPSLAVVFRFGGR
jgi:Outer membrane protein beta-barrel domain